MVIKPQTGTAPLHTHTHYRERMQNATFTLRTVR